MTMSGSYDFEEQERIAELKAWWEDNRWYVIGAIIAALAAFAGCRGWQYWSASQEADAAAMFRPVAEAAKNKDAKRLASSSQDLGAKHPRSFYASEAALLVAKDAFEANNLDEARKQLEWVAMNGVEEHRGVARMRLAAVLMDQKKYEDALRALDANTDPAFAAMAADLRGDVMLAQGRMDEARSSYKVAVEKAGPRNPVKGIAETKLQALGGTQ
jgi:predicted negative regulator of RcsB-dependent stress response